MARGFNIVSGIASTDSVTTQLTGHSLQRSFSAWAYRTGTGDSGRLFDKRVAGAQAELFFVNNSTSSWRFQRDWSPTVGQWDITPPSSDVWHHLAILYDGGAVTNDPLIYVDGLPVTVTQPGINPAGALVTNTDPYVLGNRRSDNARGWSGMIAEFAVWDRLITQQEISLLYAGQSADHFPVNLVEYITLAGPLLSKIKRLPLTSSGTLVQPHPLRIVGPSRFQPYFLEPRDWVKQPWKFQGGMGPLVAQ